MQIRLNAHKRAFVKIVVRNIPRANRRRIAENLNRCFTLRGGRKTTSAATVYIRLYLSENVSDRVYFFTEGLS